MTKYLAELSVGRSIAPQRAPHVGGFMGALDLIIWLGKPMLSFGGKKRQCTKPVAVVMW